MTPVVRSPKVGHAAETYGYAHAVGKALPWHLRRRDDRKLPGFAPRALCGAVVGSTFRPEEVRREFIGQTCQHCAIAFARAHGAPVMKGPKRTVDRSVEDAFEASVIACGLPTPVREFHFARPRRQWRFDFAWPSVKVAVDIQGGIFRGGHHVQGRAFEDDAAKYSVAAIMGWLVLIATTNHVKGGLAWRWARAAVTLRSSGHCEVPDDVVPPPYVSKKERARRDLAKVAREAERAAKRAARTRTR